MTAAAAPSGFKAASAGSPLAPGPLRFRSTLDRAWKASQRHAEGAPVRFVTQPLVRHP